MTLPESPRLRGLLFIAIGMVGCALLIGLGLLIRHLLPAGTRIWVSVPGIAGIPGALILVGLFETIVGMHFGKVAGAWDSLKGWQQGVLGVPLFFFLSAILVLVLTPVVMIVLLATGVM